MLDRPQTTPQDPTLDERALARALSGQGLSIVVLERQAEQALAEGEDPKDVWFALCREQQVPESRQWGPDQEPRS